MYHVCDPCPTCKEGKLVVAPRGSGTQFICDECGTTHANAEGTASAGGSVFKIKLRSGEKVRGKARREIDHENRGESQVRYTRIRGRAQTKVIQVAYTPHRRIKHIDCKNCGDNWYLADTPSFEGKFEFDGTNVVCKGCGAEVPIS